MENLSFNGHLRKNLTNLLKLRYVFIGFSALLIIYYLLRFGFESPFINIFGKYTPFHYGNKSGYTLPNFPDKFVVYTALIGNLIQLTSGFYGKTNILTRFGNILTLILLLPVSIYLFVIIGLAIALSFLIWIIYMAYRYVTGR